MEDFEKQSRWVFYVLFALGVGLSLFQTWQILTARLGANVFRPIHLTWILTLVFFKFPIVSSKNIHFKQLRILDILFAILSIVCGGIILSFDYNDFSYFVSGLSLQYFTAAAIFFALVIEATRRTVGMVMTVVASAFVAYNILGYLLPGRIAVKEFSIHEFLAFQIFSTNGVFGLPLGIAASVVFVFVLFGALLEVSKAGEFFTDISFAITGRYRGGPAKASVIASALLGSISGSAIANAVTTGTFTIPLMKKLGYKGHQAAGVEASASTGGQIMPPIMGAGAFIMAQFTGVAYKTIVLLCIVPAILYFASVLLYVHIMACKLGIKTSDAMSRQETWKLLKSGGHSFLAIALIFVLLILGITPALVGLLGCGVVILVSFLRKHTRISLKGFLMGLKNAAILVLPVSVACATSGIIVGVVGQTGLGLQITNFILSLSGGYLFSVFLLTTMMALVLGMGLPVTASYILLSIVSVPAFLNFGMPVIVAHIVIFWLSQTSNVTPPIALAAFAAAGIAKSKPMQSAIAAFKLSSGLMLIPLMMLYTDLLYTEEVTLYTNLLGILFTIAVILGIVLAVEGYMFVRVGKLSRIFAAVGTVLVIIPIGALRISGFILIALLVVLNTLDSRKLT